jgi:hypothetical protein
MSTAPLPEPAPRAGRKRSFFKGLFVAQGQPGELVIISHSNLFYWWPVWLAGFILAVVTYVQEGRMTIVPAGTVGARDRQVEVDPGEMAARDVLILPQDRRLPAPRDAEDPREVKQPTVRMAEGRLPGVLFAFVLVLVIAVTNIPLRGLWSLLTVLVLVLWAVILAQLHLWEIIFAGTRLLSIHINLAGYLFISLTLFVIWLVSLFFFDRQVYVTVSPGQVRVHLEIGGGEKVYDTTGMVFQKRRSDLFRHWVLGFGSGDLIIRPAGGQEQINLPNVTMVARRVRDIERRLQERAVVAAGA